MRIPGQTTSRPPPAIFKVDVSCGTSSPSFLVPFAFLTAVISNLACSSITGSLLFVSMFGHYYAVVRTHASTNHYRGPDTTGISIPITYPFVYFAALRVTNLAIYNALLYGIGIPSLSCYFLPAIYRHSLLFHLYPPPYDWISTTRNLKTLIRGRIIFKFKYLFV